MDRSVNHLPDDAALAAGLATVLRDADRPGGIVRLLERRRNDYFSTFPSEFVTYRRADGRSGRLFCKYMVALPEDHRDHGARGGVAYEAVVYERALARLDVPVPAFRGTVRDPHTGGTWLVLDDVGGAVRLTRSGNPGDLTRAAEWLGRFHAAQARRLAVAGPPPGLVAYHGDYYRGWARRTASFT
jgi:hypothetical protein